MDTLGSRIRKLRLQKGLTQIELSQGICTPSMISQIESDRARPSYKVLFGIANRLGVSLETLLSNVELHLEYLSSYKLACAMIRAKEYTAAIPLLQELLASGRGQMVAMDILNELGKCYLHSGQLDEAEKALEQVYEFALLRQEGQLVCHVLKNLGVIALQRKQYQLALYKFQRALEEFEKSAQLDNILKAMILYQIAQTYSKSGQAGDAVEYYKLAVNLYDKADHPVELAKAYLGVGQSLVKQGYFEKANEYSDRAIVLFDAVADMHMSLVTQVQCAVNEGLSGDQTAIRTIERLIVKLQELQKTADVGITYVELAKVHLHHEQLERSEEACQVARSLLPEIHVYQGWISRIHGLIAVKRNQQEEAIRFFNRAADCFKQHCEVGEWERTMHDLAQLYYRVGDAERAFGIMEEIRNYMGHLLRERGIAL